ncbi:19906_t:CDS:2, partial [Racocetra persica]
YFVQEHSDELFEDSEPEQVTTYSSNNEVSCADEIPLVENNLFVSEGSNIEETLSTDEISTNNLSAKCNNHEFSVWTYFEKQKTQNQKSTTTNLLDHLQIKHNITKKSKYQKYIQQSSNIHKKIIQQKIDALLVKPHNSKKQEKIIQKLLKLIVGEELPFILIERRWFKEFVNYIDSRFKILCVKTFSKYISQSYEYSTSLLKQILDTKRIAQLLEAAIEKWSIQNKVIIVSTDNRSNIKAVFHHHLSHIINILCIVHTLQLSIKQGIIAA